MYSLIFKLFIFLLFININFLFSDVKNPVDVLKNINKDILTIVDKNINLVDEKLNELLGEYIIPYINFDEMCLFIVGKGIWKNLSIDKKNDFIYEFKKLVIKTYSTTLNKYIRSKVIFFENKNFDNQNVQYGRKIQISSEIETIEKGKNLHVDYRMIFYKDSWKLYDLIIEGISILKGFQAQFGNDIKKNGIDFVINRMKQHNSG